MTDLKSRKIGALWIKEAKKDGRKFLAGELYPNGKNVKKYKVLILKNNNKNNEKQPDWEIFLDKSNDIDLTVTIKPEVQIPLEKKEGFDDGSQLSDEGVTGEIIEEITTEEVEKPTGPPF